MHRMVIALLFLTGCVGDAAVSTNPPDAASPGADAGGSDAQQTADAGPTSMSIPTLRNPAAAGHPTLGAKVTIAGVIVTGVKASGGTRGFFVQDSTAKEWGGVFVVVGAADVTLTAGAMVTVTGSTAVFRGFDQIDISNGRGSYVSTGSATIPAPLDLVPNDIRAGSATADKYQSMIIRVQAVKAKTATSGVDFVVTSALGNDDLIVTSYMATDSAPPPWSPTVGQTYSSITGRGYKSGSTDQNAVAKLAPLSGSDLVP